MPKYAVKMVRNNTAPLSSSASQRKEQGEQGWDGGCLGKAAGAVSHRSRRGTTVSSERCWPVKRVNRARTMEEKAEPHCWPPQMSLLCEVQQPAVLSVGKQECTAPARNPLYAPGKACWVLPFLAVRGVWGLQDPCRALLAGCWSPPVPLCLLCSDGVDVKPPAAKEGLYSHSTAPAEQQPGRDEQALSRHPLIVLWDVMPRRGTKPSQSHVPSLRGSLFPGNNDPVMNVWSKRC